MFNIRPGLARTKPSISKIGAIRIKIIEEKDYAFKPFGKLTLEL